VRRLEDGFFSISGAAVDASGKVYFVDRHEQRIYGWSPAEGLTIERDNPLDAVNLAFDKAGEPAGALFRRAEGTVYAFRPGSPKDQIAVLASEKRNRMPARGPFCRSITGITANSGISWISGTLSTRRWGRCSPRMCRLRKRDSTCRGRQPVSARGTRVPARPGKLQRQLAVFRQP